MLAAAVSALVRRDLRRTFRRVSWIGPPPHLPPDRPVIAYANHRHALDGHLLWLLARWLSRPFAIWMAEWDRFPFFGTLPWL